MSTQYLAHLADVAPSEVDGLITRFVDGCVEQYHDQRLVDDAGEQLARIETRVTGNVITVFSIDGAERLPLFRVTVEPIEGA